MKNKEVKQGQEARSYKIPKTGIDQKPIYNEKPMWRFTRMDHNGRWSWCHYGMKEFKEEVILKLAEFESRTWGEIFTTSKKQNHAIKVEEIIKEAQRRLIEMRLDDYEVVYSLRLKGKLRVFGIIQENVCYLIWLDPNHEICPSELKGT